MEKIETNEVGLAELLRDADMLATSSELSVELRNLAVPRKGMLSYYDTDRVQWSVSGYDFVFFDDDLNIRHTKINPQQLGIRGEVREGEVVERMLVDQGFLLDESEKFRAALHRQLN